MVREALRHIDDAVRAFTLNYGDVAMHLAKAREVAPECVMADLLQAWEWGICTALELVERGIPVRLPASSKTYRSKDRENDCVDCAHG